MLADDHPLIDRNPGADKEGTTILQVEQRVGDRITGIHGDQHPVFAPDNRPFVGCIFMERVVHHPGPAGLRHELGPKADQAPRRNDEFNPVGPFHRLQRHHHRLADAKLFDHCPLIRLRHIDCQIFQRLTALAIDLAKDNLRLGDRHLEAFAAHIFDQDRQVQLTTP